MGFLDKLKGAFDDVSGASAARDAAASQERLGRESIAFQKEQAGIARKDLSPFREAGQSALPGLQGLVNDPNAQQDFVQNNPFFQSLADQATNTLMSNQAAKGKLGSGGTAEALQQSLLSLGSDLVNQSVNQRQNLANTGLSAASGQAGVSQQLGQSVGQGLENIGNVQAAGIIGASNARRGMGKDLLKLGGQAISGFGGGGSSIVACDRRLKFDIQEVGSLNNGLPLYLFKYKDDPTKSLHINVMAQDVEKVNPDAIIEINGFKHVILDKIWH